MMMVMKIWRWHCLLVVETKNYDYIVSDKNNESINLAVLLSPGGGVKTWGGRRGGSMKQEINKGKISSIH